MAENTITLKEAQEWATNWRNNPENTVKAHLIPRINLTQLIAEPNTVDVRAYIGIDNEGTTKLMMVGVDENGNDLINEELKQYVYDFTRPCPSSCDIESPLYTLK